MAKYHELVNQMSLSAAEQALALEILENNLSTASVNGTKGERELAELISATLNSYGIAAEVKLIDEKRANVYARIKGADSSRLTMLNGHLDTVPYGDLTMWTSPPAEPVHKDGRIYVRGACDMKGGLSGLISSLIILRRRELLPRTDILLIATCDEESGGAGAQAAVECADLARAEFALIAEPTDLQLGIAQKSCNWLKLECRGKTGHGAYPERCCNAFEHGMALLQRLKERLSKYSHPLLGPTTMQITMAQAGVKANMSPDTAEFVADIRTTHDLSSADLERFLQEELANEQAKSELPLGEDFQASWSWLNQKSAVYCDPDTPQVQQLAAAYQEIRAAEVGQLGLSFFSDAATFSDRHTAMPILLFGPGDPGLCHQASEFIVEEDYLDFIKIMLRFLSA